MTNATAVEEQVARIADRLTAEYGDAVGPGVVRDLVDQAYDALDKQLINVALGCHSPMPLLLCNMHAALNIELLNCNKFNRERNIIPGDYPVAHRPWDIVGLSA